MKHMTNEELFKLYDSELALRLHNAKNLSDTRKVLARFLLEYLKGYPPTPELAKAFLAQYADKKPRTLYRYAQMIKGFMKWYGEPMVEPPSWLCDCFCIGSKAFIALFGTNCKIVIATNATKL